MRQNISVYGIYSQQLATEKAVFKLTTEGFKGNDISVLYSSVNAPKDESINNKQALDVETTLDSAITNLGNFLDWLSGAGSLELPNIGVVIASGPFYKALTRNGAEGGLANSFLTLGIPEVVAKRFESRIHNGEYLFSVHADNFEWAEKAFSILELTNADDLIIKRQSRSAAINEFSYLLLD